MGDKVLGRMAYVDAMKGFSIFLVVFAHSLMNAERNIDSEFAYVINFCAYVAVPSFFFINGFLYNHKSTLTPVKGILKKFKAYYVPFVGFSLFFWMFHNVFARLHLTSEEAYSIIDYIKRFVLIFAGHMESELNGPMWFLRALLIMVCMYIFIEYAAYKISNKTARYIVLTIVILVMFFVGKLGYVTKAYNLNRIFYSLSFFYMGILFRDFEVNKFIEAHRVVVFVVGMLVLIFVSCMFMGALGQNVGFKDIAGSYFGITGIFALSMFPIIQKSRFLKLLGNASLDIMSLHFLAFKLVSYIYIQIYDLDITRLSEVPVLRNIHGLYFIPYVIVGISLCIAEYEIRQRICNRFFRKRK